MDTPPGSLDALIGKRALIMGILNVTPDSFSDGGRYLHIDRAIEHAHQMLNEGADLIDVGGESTRPGSEPVSAREELDRVIPVIRALASQCAVSVDTTKFEVAAAALEAGACFLNDISGLTCEPRLAELAAAHAAHLCVMHMQGTPRTMQQAPAYENVVHEVTRFLADSRQRALTAGVPAHRIWLDPGIGFGKTVAHNLELLRHLDQICTLGSPVLVGVSRKSFIGRILNDAPTDARLFGGAAAVTAAVLSGAHMVRVHDVQAMADTVRIAEAIRDGWEPPV